jgi:hypothetical protein
MAFKFSIKQLIVIYKEELRSPDCQEARLKLLHSFFQKVQEDDYIQIYIERVIE